MKQIRIVGLVLSACFVSVAWGQQPPAKVRDWRQFHRLDMARWNKYENVLNVKNVGTLVQKWSFDTGSTLGNSLALVDGVIFGGSGNNNLYALNARTGKELWSFRGYGAEYSAPAVESGRVYFVSNSSHAYALDAK